MRVRRPILNLLSASLFVAGTAFAAGAPTPPADPPPSATALWVYYETPAPQGYILDDFDTREACEKALPGLKATPLQDDALCLRVGIDGNALHPQYGTVTKPPAK